MKSEIFLAAILKEVSFSTPLVSEFYECYLSLINEKNNEKFNYVPKNTISSLMKQHPVYNFCPHTTSPHHFIFVKKNPPPISISPDQSQITEVSDLTYT